MSRPKDRLHELRVRPGFKAILVDPKPMAPYRPAWFDGASWSVGPEQYGPLPEFPMKPATDTARALSLLEELLWRMRDWAAVYSVRTSGKETKIGVILVRQPLPASYVPVSSPKPEASMKIPWEYCECGCKSVTATVAGVHFSVYSYFDNHYLSAGNHSQRGSGMPFKSREAADDRVRELLGERKTELLQLLRNSKDYEGREVQLHS